MHDLFNMAAHNRVSPPCITNEMLAHKCPNWLHAELAKRASQQVEGLDVKALHMAMMVHCTGRFHQYSSNEFLDNCEQAIMQAMKISGLDETIRRECFKDGKSVCGKGKRKAAVALSMGVGVQNKQFSAAWVRRKKNWPGGG